MNEAYFEKLYNRYEQQRAKLQVYNDYMSNFLRICNSAAGFFRAALIIESPPHCNIVHHTAKYTAPHTETHCTTLVPSLLIFKGQGSSLHDQESNTLQYTAMHCNTLVPALLVFEGQRSSLHDRKRATVYDKTPKNNDEKSAQYYNCHMYQPHVCMY